MTRFESVCRRLAKSALVLIPLFGVPYMLFLGAQYHYISGNLELVKLYFEMTFNSFNVSTHVRRRSQSI